MSLLCSIDVAGRRRSPATTAEFHLGRTPGNKGMSYPADPPRVEEIVAVMRQGGQRCPRRPAAWTDRGAMAGGPTDRRGARPSTRAISSTGAARCW
jgi:hypothetical protein